MATAYHIPLRDGNADNNTAVTTSYVVNKQPLVRMRTSFILQKQCARAHELLTHRVAQQQRQTGLVCKRMTTRRIARQQQQPGLVRKRTTTRCVARQRWRSGLVRKRTTTRRVARRRQQQGLVRKRTQHVPLHSGDNDKNRGNKDEEVVDEASHSRHIARRQQQQQLRQC
jgi:hypothetical protein